MKKGWQKRIWKNWWKDDWSLSFGEFLLKTIIVFGAVLGIFSITSIYIFKDSLMIRDFAFFLIFLLAAMLIVYKKQHDKKKVTPKKWYWWAIVLLLDLFAYLAITKLCLDRFHMSEYSSQNFASAAAILPLLVLYSIYGQKKKR
jgi:phosphoglycerol transferase MdoB-like AlkP superfamily enzyme